MDPRLKMLIIDALLVLAFAAIAYIVARLEARGE